MNELNNDKREWHYWAIHFDSHDPGFRSLHARYPPFFEIDFDFEFFVEEWSHGIQENAKNTGCKFINDKSKNL